MPAPHTPMLATAEFQGRSGLNPYGDFCLQVDDVVGQIMDALDAAGATLREATVHSSVDGSLSIRQGRWKLEMCPGSGGWSYPRPGLDDLGWPPVQPYDLAADIGERHNV